MKIMKLNMRETGIYKKLGEVEYFVPHNLPPENPKLQLDSKLIELYGEASFALGNLNEISSRLPDANRFLKSYVIKEALLSSAIEGVHTTLLEVFTAPLEGSRPSKDTQLVLNYTEALAIALNMMHEEGIPLSQRMILKSHAALMGSGEGDKYSPGLYRKQQVRVGELVPASADHIPDLMSSLEKFINNNSEIPPLIAAGLAHVQFETIHPFLDGNGRIGRLLIVLMLIAKGLLKYPVLYPSYYFKKNHFEYYRHLDRVRTHGDYEGWVTFYLTAIRDSAKDAHRRANDIENLVFALEDAIDNDDIFKGIRETSKLILDTLFISPITTITEVSSKIDKSYNTANKAIMAFVEKGILLEDVKGPRRKTYRFKAYLDLLEKEY